MTYAINNDYNHFASVQYTRPGCLSPARFKRLNGEEQPVARCPEATTHMNQNKQCELLDFNGLRTEPAVAGRRWCAGPPDYAKTIPQGA